MELFNTGYKPLKKYFNKDFLYNYSDLHNAFVYDSFVRDLNSSLMSISGSTAMNHLLASQADNAKSAQEIISDSFVRRAYDEGISSCRRTDGPTYQHTNIPTYQHTMNFIYC